MKVLRIFKGLFQKPLKARFGTAVPTYYDKLKKRGFLRVFSCALNVGASAPNPDAKDFSRKVLWKLKSFAKVKWCISVGNFFAYFSYKKSRSRKND